MSTATPALTSPRTQTATETTRRLYLGISILVAAIAWVGFAGTYWVPMTAGTLAIHPAIHVHAFLFFAWTLLAVVQASLVSRGRVRVHRDLGLLGIALAALMVFSGALAAIVSLQRNIPGPRPDVARASAALSVFGISLFATFFTAGIVSLRHPERHRRLMVLASLAILQAAIARPLRLVTVLSLAQRTLVGAVILDAILLAIVALDRRVTGRLHPAWIWGASGLIATQLLRMVIVPSAAWIHFTDWLSVLGR